MSIKSDKWIRRMVEHHRMIEPFESGQVRDSEQGKVISYGTSSYGYDVRCANEFKVFTNINSAVVDPKNFDPNSFVDVVSDVCIIPPNSFALARTVEFFRIPRDVLTICLGKSTYARCFSGDTPIALANGTAVTFKAMVKRYGKGERFFGYGFHKKLGLVVTELVEPRKVASGERLLRVTYDNGDYDDCTPEHRFLLKKGKYKQAKDLSIGESLMPLYRYRPGEREVVFCPSPEASRILNCSDAHLHTHHTAIISKATTKGYITRKNHKVVSVQELPGFHDVYCLTSPETGNFALDSGVFVKNCGLIVNVTPLEPEWEGHVTLEFSNTTTLPAKIYANEGVAQMLFFGGDEVCETSYKDRGGKYQGQTGVTLPSA